MPTLQKIRSAKNKYCKGTGSYKDMRSACKKYVDAAVSKAKKGTKTKTRQLATKRAQKIIKSSCNIL